MLSYVPGPIASLKAYRGTLQAGTWKYTKRPYTALLLSAKRREFAVVAQTMRPAGTSIVRLPFSAINAVELGADVAAYGARTVSETMVMGSAAPTRSVTSAANPRIEIHVDDLLHPVHTVYIENMDLAATMHARVQLLMRGPGHVAKTDAQA